MSVKKRTSITLGGKDYDLVPSFEGLDYIEDLTGKGLLELGQEMSKGKVSVKIIACIIYAGILGSGDKSMSVKQIGQLIVESDGGFISYVKPATEFLKVAIMGNSKVDEVDEAPEAAKKP